MGRGASTLWTARSPVLLVQEESGRSPPSHHNQQQPGREGQAAGDGQANHPASAESTRGYPLAMVRAKVALQQLIRSAAAFQAGEPARQRFQCSRLQQVLAGLRAGSAAAVLVSTAVDPAAEVALDAAATVPDLVVDAPHLLQPR